MKKALFLSLILFVSAVATQIAPAAIAETRTLKVSHQFPVGDTRDLWVRKWAELVSQLSHGTLKFEFYPAAALYKPNAQFDAMRKGALDVAVLHQIYLTGRIPEYEITSMPTLVSSENVAMRWSSGELGKKLYEIGKKNGFRTVSWGSPLGTFGSKKKPILVPADLKAMKVRGAGKATEDWMRAAGASIVSMPSTEVYFALQGGILDALTTTYSTFLSQRLYEVLDYLTVSKTHSLFSAQVGILVANSTWDRLTPEQRQAIEEAGKKVEPYFADLSKKETGKCLKAFQQKGVKVVYMTAAQERQWHELAVQSAYKDFSSKVASGKELLDLAQKANKE